MRFTRLAALVVMLAASAAASYHFVRYSSRFGFQTPIYERFDLNALVNRTVPFFIVSDGQQQLAPGDNSNALMSQVLMAARTWSNVATSELRLTFGGYAAAATGPQSTPGIDVIFSEDVPPGVISYAGPTVKADTDLNSQAPFTPILRSLVVFRKDLRNIDGVAYPSFSEAFFLNAVHEFGHALGLQHTFTSSAMSTQLTRATTRSKPLAADDIAAISILYPSKNFENLFGSVSGRITQNGTGVNMASVVALSLNGTAVSTLSNPDGTYRIQGVPPGPYQIYVHPIPPPIRGQATPGDIILPRDPENNTIPANNRFDLQFFPGTRDPQAAQTINVLAAQPLSDINFSVNSRTSAPTLFYPTTYSYFTNPVTNTGNYVRPAFITPQVLNPGFIASGFGFVTTDSKPIPGLRSTILGGSPAINNVRGFSNQFIIFDLFLSGFLSEGERHMVLDNGTESYILPSAIQVATRRAPEVTNVNWIAPAADGTRLAQITGSSITSRTRVLIDGEEAPARSIDESAGTIVVGAPPAPTGHVARIVLLGSDGQSSLFLRPDAPAQLRYTDSEANSFTLSPSTLIAGSETVIEVNAPGARFQNGRVTLGFGSSDVQVRTLSVLSPSRLLASVVVSPQAPSESLIATLQSGLNHIQIRNALSVQQTTAAFSKPILQPDSRWTTESGSPMVMPGSNAVVAIPGLTSGTRVTATLNDLPASVLTSGNGRLTLSVPANLSSGWVHLKLTADGETFNSLLVLVSAANPTIQRIEGSDQFVIDSNRPMFSGDTIAVTFTDPSQLIDSSPRANEVTFSLGETSLYTLRVDRLSANLFQAIIVLPRALPEGNQPFTVAVNSRQSSPLTLPVRSR
ncbi:MAG: matrixin family metalloprotease [Acidobacteria bacterium]|nr:matrixin family metalloprotease [Acidobacteriota bacterium]